MAKSYATSADGTRFSQTCSAARVIGVSQRNIMDFNKDISYTVHTGYKLWSSTEDETVDEERDAATVAQEAEAAMEDGEAGAVTSDEETEDNEGGSVTENDE